MVRTEHAILYAMHFTEKYSKKQTNKETKQKMLFPSKTNHMSIFQTDMTSFKIEVGTHWGVWGHVRRDRISLK